MTGVLNRLGGRMGDYDDQNSSGGIIGTIISILILAAVWPYLLALLGLYIAYIAAVAVLEWMAQNPLTVVLMLLGITLVYGVFHYRPLSKLWSWMNGQLRHKSIEVHLAHNQTILGAPDFAQRKFVPSTNMYCYWCTSKLGVKAFELNGKYYCYECNQKLLKNILD